MPQRPYVLLSAAVSADGYIDDAGLGRLVLSDAADLDRVDEVRAGADAILVGAGTIRADNPRLLVRSAARRVARAAAGRPASPIRVTLTSRGGLDPAARFFTAEPGTAVEPASMSPTASMTETASITGTGGMTGTGGPCSGRGERIVYAAGPVASRVREQVGATGAVVADMGTGGLSWILADLGERGVERVLVEGGASVLTGFLTAGLADELQLMVAPFFVGGGVRLTREGTYPHGPANPMTLAQASRLGDGVLLRYLL